MESPDLRLYTEQRNSVWLPSHRFRLIQLLHCFALLGVLRSISWSQHLFQKLPCIKLHPRQVERSFPHIAFNRTAYVSIPAQIAKPFAVLSIRKMGKGPLVQTLIPIGPLALASQITSQQTGIQGFIMGPPKLQLSSYGSACLPSQSTK